MATRMLQRRGSAAEWAASNPILGDGEIGWERDTNLLKLGDGINAWNDLPYIIDADLSELASLDSSTSGAIASDGAGWIKKTYAQFKTSLALVKADVGLGNVDNTSDVNKPVSTAQQTALNILAASTQPVDPDLTTIAALDSGTTGAIASDGAGWIKKTYAQFKTSLALVKADVGLGNVDNTSDVNKPVSTAQQTALDAKESSAHATATYATITDAVSKSAAAQQVVAGAGGFKATNGLWDGVNRVYSASNPPPSGGGAVINQTIRGTVSASSTGSIGSESSTAVTIPTVVMAKTQVRLLSDHSVALTSSTSSASGPISIAVAARLQLTGVTTLTVTSAAKSTNPQTIGYELTEWT